MESPAQIRARGRQRQEADRLTRSARPTPRAAASWFPGLGEQPSPDEALFSFRNEQGHVLMAEPEADGLVWMPGTPAQLGPVHDGSRGPGSWAKAPGPPHSGLKHSSPPQTARNAATAFCEIC